MLRITVSHEAGGTSFALSGRLAGPWVEEFRRCWRSATDPNGRRGGAVRVDLRHTTFVDEAGKALLSDMQRCGVGFLASGCMMRAVVEELTI